MADNDMNRDYNDRDTNSDDDRYRPDETPRVAALSDLGDFQVADGYPDPRGWDVVAADGNKVGKVHDLIVDTGSMRTRYLDVKLDHDKVPAAAGKRDDDWDVLIPVGAARLADDNDEVILPSMSATQLAVLPVFEHGEITRDYENQVLTGVGGAAAGATAATAGSRDFYDTQHFDDRNFFGRGQQVADTRTDNNIGNKDNDTRRITLAEEELDISKREVKAGEATVHKTIETEHVKKPVTLRREEVTIERRPVEGRQAGNVTIGKDNEIHIPLMSEEAVVNKRAVAKEEIVIKKHAVSDTEEVEADIRKERVEVDQPDQKDTDRIRKADNSNADQTRNP